MVTLEALSPCHLCQAALMPCSWSRMQDNGPVLDAGSLGGSVDPPNGIYRTDGNSAELCYVNGISIIYR